jgi:ribosomal protein S4
MRIAEKRTAIFFCIFNLKKLRYILNSSQKFMVLSNLYYIKLETMVNVVLFRLNLFNSIKLSTNFIKIAGFWINSNKVIYPYRFIKPNDIF